MTLGDKWFGSLVTVQRPAELSRKEFAQSLEDLAVLELIILEAPMEAPDLIWARGDCAYVKKRIGL